MVSIGTETNEREPDRTFRSRLPTGAVPGSAEEYSIPQAGPTKSGQSDIVMMDAALLEDTIRSRRVSCVEVMNAYLDHIENLNPKVNAIVALQDRPGLLAQARECDAQLARGESIGPLHQLEAFWFEQLDLGDCAESEFVAFAFDDVLHYIFAIGIARRPGLDLFGDANSLEQFLQVKSAGRGVVDD